VLTLTKLSETSSTLTLSWAPPVGVGGYVLYANGQAVSVATANLKDGSARNSAKFSKTTPGPPYQVAALCRSGSGVFSVEVGTYPGGASQTIYPSNTLYPSEVSP
jgi:hypothetical protein